MDLVNIFLKFCGSFLNWRINMWGMQKYSWTVYYSVSWNFLHFFALENSWFLWKMLVNIETYSFSLPESNEQYFVNWQKLQVISTYILQMNIISHNNICHNVTLHVFRHNVIHQIVIMSSIIFNAAICHNVTCFNVLYHTVIRHTDICNDIIRYNHVTMSSFWLSLNSCRHKSVMGRGVHLSSTKYLKYKCSFTGYMK